MQTLSELLRSQARHFGGKTFLVFADKSWTYAAYVDQVEKLARVLVDHGVTKGQPVCLYLPSRPELAFAYHACQLIGAIATPMSAMYRSAEITKIVTRTGARVLITDTERAPHVRGVQSGLASLQHVLVFGGDDRAAPLEGLLSLATADLPDDAVGPEDVGALFFTSGTTGEPKGAMQSQRSILAGVRGGDVYTACASGREVFLCVLPLFNNFGATVLLNGALYNGGTLILRERWDLDAVVADIRRHKVTVFFGTPTMFTFLLKGHEAGRYDLSSLRLCLAGGAVLVPSLVEEFERKFRARLMNIYGATEVSGYVTAEPLHGPRIPGSVGLPIGSTTIAVLDDNCRPVARGQTGEIAIAGDTVGPGYWRDAKATENAFRNGAWLSGDIGFLDEHDHLHIIDRKKDVIISGGFNIYPLEVEDVLLKRNDVALCALIGAPDAEKGEVPVAYVVPVSGKSPTAEELIAYCRANLAAYKAPRRNMFRDALPLGPTGKILKTELRDMIAKESSGA
ncbi:MAG: class I adenylate-forming enzyme family protein [Hyphomicrobiaceae bacterium]